MNSSKKIILSVFFFFAIALSLRATHNRAGEITYKWIGGYSYEVTVTTYTKESSLADRCELTIYFGDGDSCVASRANGPNNGNCSPYGMGQTLSNDTKVNIYKCVHTYPGAGQFWISMEDPNRNGGILNIPNSVNTVFYIRSLLIINSFAGGTNNSPVLLNPPIDNACQGKCFEHNPGAFDPDGDSLSFKLVTCLESGGSPINGYSIPPTTSTISINPYNGDFIWCTPPTIGQYNIAILIEEWRYGSLIGSILRDMQIDVTPCNNNPPNFLALKDTCVEAGTTINFNVTAIDPDNNNVVLSAVGGPLSPFVATPAASFPIVTGSVTAVSTFSWTTVCGHARKQPYIVTFKALDDAFNIPLANFSSINLTVVAPSPKNVTATPAGSSIILNWNSAICPQTIGYQIYRKDTCSPYVHSPCQTGVAPNSGYVLIGTTTGINSTTFTDNNNGFGLIHGKEYSYIIVTILADGSFSFASANVCGKLVRDVPVITNVDVKITNTSTGEIEIKWVKPIADASNLDTIANPGPYEYRLMRTVGFTANNFTQIANFTSPSFTGLSATAYTDVLLNTTDNPYKYRIDFYSNGILKGSTQTASSVYLSIAPFDNLLKLSWNEVVPWTNKRYVIYRLNTLTLVFDSIGQSFVNAYNDSNLVNGANYCYKVKSIGSYSDNTLPKPLINFSQEKCSSPVDKQAPCAPKLFVKDDCVAVTNLLSWINSGVVACADDIVQYKIYYTPVSTESFQLLYTSPLYSVTDTSYLHNDITSIAGCYVVTAIDSFANESVVSNQICIDNCPAYELPNVFTPNGDGRNDFYKAIVNRFVKNINIKIYNRWGSEVYTSTDAAFKWDGRSAETKQLCSDGTYFYVCTINEIRVAGITPRTVKGFIQLINNTGNPNNN